MKIDNSRKIKYEPVLEQTNTNNLPKTRNSNQIFDEKFEREIRDNFLNRTLGCMSQPFLRDTPVVNCYNNFRNISMLNKYISQYPQLSRFNISVDVLLDFLQNAKYKGVLLEYDFDTKKESIDNLAKFAAEKENQRLMEAFGSELLENILFLGEDMVSTFDKDCLKNLQKLSCTNCFESMFHSLSYDFMQVLGQNKDYSEIVNKNMKILEKLYNNPEYAGIINNFVHPFTLVFTGDLEKALELFKDKYSNKANDEVLELSTNIENGNLLISSTTKMGEELTLSKNIYYDKNLNVTFEKSKIVGKNNDNCVTDNTYVSDKKLATDYRYRQVYDKGFRAFVLTDVNKIVKDNNGKTEFVRLTKKSDTEGVYNIKECHNGKIRTVCSALKNDNGVSVNKKLISPDGTLTKYFYERSADNSKEILFCIIKDVTGKILAKKHCIFNKISDNLALNKVNDIIYQIEYKPDSIKVINDKTKEEIILDLNKLVPSNNPKIINLLKTLSAPELINISKTVTNLNFATDKSSFFSPITNAIFTADNKFTLEHELGHAKDNAKIDIKQYCKKPINVLIAPKQIISVDKNLQAIYKEEKDRLSLVMPKEERTFASYLLSSTLIRPLSEVLKEIVADTNGVLNTPEAPDVCAYRVNLYQENFPRTIAYLMNNYDF